MSQEERVRRLLELYQKASPLISTSVIKALVEAKATSKASDSLFELAKPDSITITSGNFSETINPITRQGIDASLRRLISPYRLVYNLTGDGEKSVLDQSPLGISQWAQALSESKIFVDDCLWVGSKLPPEALAAHALILAGPRRPLGEEREKALMDYLISGGKLIIFQDPMVVGFGAAALESIGLNLPWGLVVDPTSTWAGTEDFFIVSRDYPAHPVTLGLEQPVIWPLTGAVTVTSKANLPENPLDPVIAPQTDPTGPTGHTWAVALSSPAAWLETDRKSLAERSHRYQSQSDLPGQLVLASATTLSSGGRLMLLADADLAANSFINYAGNLAFLNNAIFWLLGAQDDLATSQAVTWLDLTDTKARLLFWLPTVIWPVLMIVIWFIWQFKRRRRASS
jgi:hypothetical protein